jgi:mRNA interferase RelE/StbE
MELEGLRLEVRRRIAGKIAALGTTLQPPGVEKLSGQEKYRIRQGDYCMVCAIADDAQTATVFKIGHRRDVYR